MAHNDFILPLQLQPLFQQDDETIFSESIPRRYLARQLGIHWYREMEEIHQNVSVGTRLLIRRESYNGIITDHITTYVTRQTFYGNWTHQTVVYREDEFTPYPFDMDCFHNRSELMEIYRNNQLLPPNPYLEEIQEQQDFAAMAEQFLAPPPQEGVNPLGEGQMWVDEDDQPLMFPLSPIHHLSSRALFSNWSQ